MTTNLKSYTIDSNSLTNAPQKPLKLIGAVVQSVSGSNITVRLAGESTSNIVIPNLTGQTLATNDVVQVMIKNGNYGNAFVAFKNV